MSRKMYWSSFPLLLLLLEGQQSSTTTLNVLTGFKVPKYDPTGQRNAGEYVGENIAIIDVDYWKGKSITLLKN